MFASRLAAAGHLCRESAGESVKKSGLHTDLSVGWPTQAGFAAKAGIWAMLRPTVYRAGHEGAPMRAIVVYTGEMMIATNRISFRPMRERDGE
ncbi:hypothetical protein RA307_23060 [Xanthobacteraceae bacterium Astr-EGSB]|uniref:hypothetical protein n=1 Tax=Astrobacterium formosum TaxID=3069710 RepID=UPI0027B39B5A|nr:hypothetical protein [Xanthobacteraceae bacterium Astr-EGSB]